MEGTDVVAFQKYLKNKLNDKSISLTSTVVLTPIDKALANTVRRAETVVHEMESNTNLEIIHDTYSQGLCTLCTELNTRPPIVVSLPMTKSEIASMEVLPKVLY